MSHPWLNEKSKYKIVCSVTNIWKWIEDGQQETKPQDPIISFT